MATYTEKTKITKNTLRKHLKPSEREKHTKQIIRDTELPGFSLVVNQGAVGSWWVQFRPKGKTSQGKRWHYKSVKVGDSSTHSIEEARDEAKMIKAAVIAGRDPHQEAIDEREARDAEEQKKKSLTNVLELYLASVDANSKISESYRRSEKIYVRKAVSVLQPAEKKNTGSKPKKTGLTLDAIDGQEVTDAFNAAECSQHAKKHMDGAFYRLMDFCVWKKWLTVNPMKSVPRKKRVQRGSDRDVTPSMETLAKLWHAAEKEEPVIRDMVRFMLLVPARRGTVTEMDWSEVDLKGKVWNQPAQKTKSGKPHKLQLSPKAIEILRSRQFPTKGKGLVFPSVKSGTSFKAWGKLKVRLSKVAGIKPDAWRFHDFRRSFVSVLAEMKHDETVVDLVLHHSASATRGGVLGVYQQSERMEDRKAALFDWSDRLINEAEKLIEEERKTA